MSEHEIQMIDLQREERRNIERNNERRTERNGIWKENESLDVREKCIGLLCEVRCCLFLQFLL